MRVSGANPQTAICQRPALKRPRRISCSFFCGRGVRRRNTNSTGETLAGRLSAKRPLQGPWDVSHRVDPRMVDSRNHDLTGENRRKFMQPKGMPSKIEFTKSGASTVLCQPTRTLKHTANRPSRRQKAGAAETHNVVGPKPVHTRTRVLEGERSAPEERPSQITGMAGSTAIRVAIAELVESTFQRPASRAIRCVLPPSDASTFMPRA